MEKFLYGTNKVIAILLILILTMVLFIPLTNVNAAKATNATNTSCTNIIFTQYARKRYISGERNGRSSILWFKIF